MMPLRHTPVLSPGLGAKPPSCANIGASSGAGPAGGGVKMLLAGGGRICGAADRILSAAAFSADFYRSAASPIEEDWRLLPPLIARAVLPVTVSAGFVGRLRACA